jgi:hypothetical protein
MYSSLTLKDKEQLTFKFHSIIVCSVSPNMLFSSTQRVNPWLWKVKNMLTHLDHKELLITNVAICNCDQNFEYFKLKNFLFSNLQTGSLGTSNFFKMKGAGQI